MIKYDNVLVLKINKYFLVTRFSTVTMGLLNDEGNKPVCRRNYRRANTVLECDELYLFSFCGLNQ